MLDTPPLEHVHDDENGFIGEMDDDMMLASDPIPSSPAANAADRKGQHAVKVEEYDDEDMMEIAQAVGDTNAKTTTSTYQAHDQRRRSRKLQHTHRQPALPQLGLLFLMQMLQAGTKSPLS